MISTRFRYLLIVLVLSFALGLSACRKEKPVGEDPLPTEITAISTLLQEQKNDEIIRIEGTVYHKNTTGFFLRDSDNTFLFVSTENVSAYDQNDYPLRQVVQAVGTFSVQGGKPQLHSVLALEIKPQTGSLPEAEPLTLTQLKQLSTSLTAHVWYRPFFLTGTVINLEGQRGLLDLAENFIPFSDSTSSEFIETLHSRTINVRIIPLDYDTDTWVVEPLETSTEVRFVQRDYSDLKNILDTWLEPLLPLVTKDDIFLPNAHPLVKSITWTSSDSIILNSLGQVNYRGFEHTTVILSALIEADGHTFDFHYVIEIIPTYPDTYSIGDVFLYFEDEQAFSAEAYVLNVLYTTSGHPESVILQDLISGQTMLMPLTALASVFEVDFNLGDHILIDGELSVSDSDDADEIRTIANVMSLEVTASAQPAIDYRAHAILIDSYSSFLQALNKNYLKLGAVYHFTGNFFFEYQPDNPYLSFHYNEQAVSSSEMVIEGRHASFYIAKQEHYLTSNWLTHLFDVTETSAPGTAKQGSFYALLSAVSSSHIEFVGLHDDDFSIQEGHSDHPYGYTVTKSWLAEGTPDQIMLYHIDTLIEGPTIFIIGGIHSDERAGWHTALQLLDEPFEKGEIYIIPFAYKRAFFHLPYPVRHLLGENDINRLFPGNTDGNAQDYLVHEIFQAILAANPDYVFDLHESRQSRLQGNLGDSVIMAHQPSISFLNAVLADFNAHPSRLGQTPFVRLNATTTGLINVEVTNALNIPVFTIETSRQSDDASIPAEGRALSIRIEEQRLLISIFLEHIYS